MTKATIKAAGDVAAYGDNIDKMSQKMGLSAEAYQEWDAIMQHSGTSIESLQAGMKTLANAVETGNSAFDRLGITQEQIASMNNEELFAATITALQNIENETERTYLAGQLLGRGATELGALLNMSSEETEAMRKRVHELGGVMSDEAVKASAAYQDSLQDMKTAFSGLSRGMISGFLPSITKVMDGLTEMFSGNGESGISLISDGLSSFVGNIKNTIPRIISLGSEILTGLSGAFIENLPMLISAGSEIVLMIINGAIEQLPSLAMAAIEIITTIANGMSDSFPTMIPTIVDVILRIVETLIDNTDMLVDSAIEIILALATGLIDAIPILIDKAPALINSLLGALIANAPKLLSAGWQIISQIASGILGSLSTLGSTAAQMVGTIRDELSRLISSAFTWGSDFISGLGQGILSGVTWLWDQVKGIAEGIASFLHFSRPDEGPLRDYETWMPDFMQGLAKGIDRNKYLITDALSDMTSDMSATVDVSANRTSAAGTMEQSLAQPITIIVQSVLDGRVIGETAYNYNLNRAKAYGA